MNKVDIIGRLTKAPELRGTDETPVCAMRVAVPRRPKGDEDPGAVFIDVIAFGGLAGTCHKYLEQGRQVAVSGRLEQQEWEDKETSAKRSRIEIIADEVDFLARPQSASEDK